MAKQKLTKAAIGFIIEKRNDWNVNYTFTDIAKLLEENFDITITEQAVSKSYHKHKDDQAFRTYLIPAKKQSINAGEPINNRVTNDLVKPTATKSTVKDFNEGEWQGYDFDQFFKPKE